MATSQLAMWAASVALFLMCHTCWAQQGVCYVRVSSLQSYSASVSHQFRTCHRKWWIKRCRTVYRAGYFTRYRTVYGSHFACCHGYKQVGPWHCIPVDCGTLTVPANGQVTYSDRTTFGHTATYSCHTGYNLIGGTTRMCQARGTTGVWSGSAPTCHPVDCGTLTNPANGQVSHTDGTTLRYTVTYSCDTGYNLVGDSTRTCQATRVWSGSAPTCQPVNCSNLTDPANGRVSHTGGTTFGQTATYRCNTGYNLVGGSTRTCDATRVWSGSAPTCQLIHNSLFQIHLYGAIVCQEWVTSDKASDIAQDVARELEIICTCGFSDKYIGGMRLVCGDGNSTGEVIFLARMISFDGMNSTDLLSRLQQWVQTRPTITVSGVPMTVSGDCSVSLGELSRPMCIPITIPSSPEPTTPRTNTANHNESSPTNLHVIPITAGLVGGMFFYIVIIMLVAVVLICKRRKRNHQGNSDHYTTTMHEASEMDKQSNRSTESKLSTGDNKEEHLYEPLPEHTPSQSDDPCMQQTSTVTNPYSTPNGDDGHLNTETRC